MGLLTNCCQYQYQPYQISVLRRTRRSCFHWLSIPLFTGKFKPFRFLTTLRRSTRRMTPTARTRRRYTQDDDSLDSSQASSNGNHSKLGRRGDPRMHRAVAARLANPALTLVEALRTGGFNYPEVVYDDHYILENDTVSLGQRKNQLSRRCRLAKQHADPSVKTKRQKRKKQTNPDPICSMEPSDDFPTGSRGQKRQLTFPEDDMMDEGEMQGSARQRMAKFHPQYHQIVVPQTHHNLGSL